jgi:hypothetical protein
MSINVDTLSSLLAPVLNGLWAWNTKREQIERLKRNKLEKNLNIASGFEI